MTKLPSISSSHESGLSSAGPWTQLILARASKDTVLTIPG